MTPAWKDGIQALLRAAKRGTRMALDDEEALIVRKVINTVIIAEQDGR